MITGAVITWLADPHRPLTSQAANASLDGLVPRRLEVEVGRAAVLTQTCDVVRSCGVDPFVQIAPVVDLTGHRLLGEARGGHSPRYAPLPGLGANFFADLSLCGSVEKSTLVELNPVDGCGSDEARADFASAVARNRSRFAFPDGLDEVLKKLRKRFRDKHNSETSAEGRRLRDLVEIRVASANGWDHDPPFHLTLKFIVDEEALPDGAEEFEMSPATANLLSDGAETDQIAESLDLPDLGPGDRYRLWQALAAKWLGRCGTDPRVMIDDAEAVSAATYTLAESRREPTLDLDHLSSREESPEG